MRMRGSSNPFPPLLSIFQEPSTITEVMEEIFEVNVNGDIEDMDLGDFTQDTSSKEESNSAPNSPQKKNPTPKP